MTTNSPPQRNSVSPNAGEKIPALDLPSQRISSPAGYVGRASSLAIWAHRAGVMLFVSVCAVVGVLLMILPWTPKWTDNYILIAYPALRDFLEDGFVRGMCTGLGAIDVWIGFSEATHYHEKENRH